MQIILFHTVVTTYIYFYFILFCSFKQVSRIEELRLFQLALQHRRSTMPFSTTAKVFAGEEFVDKTVTSSQRKITIKPSDRLLDIDNFVLPRQPLVLTEETGIKLRMTDYLNITIKFGTLQERTRFIRALGDLDLL
jgi:hypothetical protein